MADDPYATLGIPRDASPAAIKRAFRAKARVMHPDAGGSAEGFERLKAAFDCLSDPAARARYDGTAPAPDAAKMQAWMAFALDSVLLKLRQKPQGLASEELMALMAARLMERRAEIAHEKAQLARALAATEDILARPDIGQGLMHAAAEDRKARCEQRIAAVAADLETLEACVRELRGGAPADPAPQPPPDFGEWVDVDATVG